MAEFLKSPHGEIKLLLCYPGSAEIRLALALDADEGDADKIAFLGIL